MLSTTDAARVLGVHPNTVRWYMARGRLVYVWTPLGRLIPAEEVERMRVLRAAKAEEVPT